MTLNFNDAERPNNPSTNRYLSQLRAYLQDDDESFRIIGIWGMGGVGKTTLLNCLNNELRSSSGQTLSEFEHVIWVAASKDYNLNNLQRDVAQSLLLPTHRDKAKQARVIFDFLKHRSFLLLIDDLWQPLDFTGAGFPNPLRTETSGPKQKVVFTTRLEGVCEKMKARRILKLECLNEDDAWRLFQDNVGKEALQAHAMIPQLARQVAKECGGLPLALAVIGATMSTKNTPMEWCNALALLKKSRLLELPETEEGTYLPKLKFSYDNLADKAKQKCFLLCCLWPEDFYILKTGLIECWMGHGFVDVRKFDNINEAYDSGHALISSFLAACLLEPGKNPDKEVKLHNVVRDLALWIASNYGDKPNKFIVNSGDINFEDTESEVERMSLRSANVKLKSIFPSNYSKLETLILQNIPYYWSIPPRFFKGLPSLAYLDLSNNFTSELPSEIGLPSNLRYLNLSHTQITSLPLELGNLCELKFLILRYMPEGLIIPKGLIEKLEVLSVLDMFHTECKNWKEVLRLQGFLKGVGICLTTIESLQLFQLSNMPIWQLELRELVGFNGPLHLESLSNQSSIQSLAIEDCESLKVMSIGSNSQSGSLSRLEELAISGLTELKRIVFRGVVPTKLLPSLTKLTISSCEKLLSISWVMCLPSLEVLIVSDCQKMEKVIDEESDGGIDENVESASESSDAFPSLKEIGLHELPRLRMFAEKLLTFPLLETLVVSMCPEMKTLPFGSEITNKKLKMIKGDRGWWAALEMDEDVRVALSTRFLETKCKMQANDGSILWRINRRVQKLMFDNEKEVSVTELSENLGMSSYLSQLRAYIQDYNDETRIIGILGKGGVGKTTLLQCLNNELQSSFKSGQTLLEFTHIIWVVASKDYKLEKLQHEIAEQLRLPLHQDKAKQAKVIFDFLKKSSFLLLLDDLWQPFDFAEVGIPHPLGARTSVSKQKVGISHPLRTRTSFPKQNVVFTTRLEGVCGNMQARCILKLDCLNKDNALRLFQDKVGEETLKAHVMIPQLARQVSEECDGIPFALMVMGAAMSTKKTPMEWHNAIELLEKSRLPVIYDMEDGNILSKLKFSFDNLADEIKQKCFLLCCLWPKDFSIKKIDLIECWMGHGLIDLTKFNNIFEAYDSGHAIISNLLAAFLLEPGKNHDKDVKMHYMVRYLALWIASNYGEKPNNFIVNSNAKGFEDMHSEVERIMLMFPKARNTPVLPSNCSKLETLIINHRKWFGSMHTGFFKGAHALAYLDLSHTHIFELPSEISLLCNLQYLNLSHTCITYLPFQLGHLIKLRFLVLRSMYIIFIPDGLIEKLEMLHLLDMTSTWCKNWKEISRLRGFSNGVEVCLKTTQALQKLTQLSNVHVWRLELLRLKGFKGPLQLGSLGNQSSIKKLNIKSCKSLKVVSFDPNSQKGSLSRLDELDISYLPKLKNIVFRGVEPAKMMSGLTKLSISMCRKLLNISWAISLPNLEVLIVFECPKMNQVIDENLEGETIAGENVASAGESGDAFPRLKNITLEALPSLRMFANGLLAFPSLEKLEVTACPKFKTLPFGLEIIGKRLNAIYGGKNWWEELEMEEDARAAFSPLFFEHKNDYLGASYDN